MATPESTLATQRPDLGSMMEFGLAADRQGFIAAGICPVLEVAQQAGSYGILPIEQMLQSHNTVRAPRTPYNRGDFTFQPGTYATQEHGFEGVIDEREAKMYRNYFDAEAITAQRTLDIVLREYEKRVATLLTTNGSFTNTAVTTDWGTVATSVPITDVTEAKIRIHTATGLWPNAVQITYLQYLRLRETTQILDKIKYIEGTLPAEIGVSQIKQAFDVPYVFIAGASQNSANIGQAASLSSIWDDTKVGVGVVATTNDIQEPCVARTFHWGEDGSQIGTAMEEYDEVQTRAKIIRCRFETEEKLMYALTWQLLTGATS